MIVYVGKTIKVTVSGQRTMDCTCEKCKTRYVYEMARAAAGQADAPYGMGQKGAAEIADYRARVALYEMLKNDLDLVACPRCGWVNRDSVRAYQHGRYRILAILGIGVAVIGALIVFCISIDHVQKHPQDFHTGALLAGVGLVGSLTLIATLLWARRVLLNRLDPNLFHPKWPDLPDGTPDAIPVDASGNPMAFTPRPAKAFNGWATLQNGRHTLPECCCQCLGEATTYFSTPFKVNAESDIGVPLCKRCHRRLIWKWWGAALLTLPAAAGVSSLMLLVPAPDDFGRWFLFGIVALFVTLFALAIVPGRIVRPFRMRTIDAKLGIYAFRFKNEAYTRLLTDVAKLKPAHATIASASISI